MEALQYQSVITSPKGMHMGKERKTERERKDKSTKTSLPVGHMTRLGCCAVLVKVVLTGQIYQVVG